VPALEVTEAPSVEEVQAPEVTQQLFAAIAEGNVVAMEELFAAGASTDVYNDEGVTPLIAAIRLDDPAVVGAILDKGVDTNLPEVSVSFPFLLSRCTA
jgi:ankyrin repeat protein